MLNLVYTYNDKHKFGVIFKDAISQAISNISGPHIGAGNYCTNFRLLKHRYYASVTPLANCEFAVFMYDDDQPDFNDMICCKKEANVTIVGLISLVANFILEKIFMKEKADE